MMRRTPKDKGPKKVTYSLIKADTDIGKPMYELLEQIVRANHEELSQFGARIALAWCTSWKPDADGRVTIGKCKKASDLDRELAPWDFAILLSRDFWERATEKQRAALIDHELCHAAVKYDEKGEAVSDTRGRTVFRTRKHDLEEFSEVVRRHGTYKRDLEVFAKALDRARVQAGTGWVGYSNLQSKLHYAGLDVPVERIVEWSDEERRRCLEWVSLRAELLKSNASITVPTPPDFVLNAVVQPSVLGQTGT